MKWFSQINNSITLHNNSLSAWAALITVISLPLVLIGLFVGYHQILDILTLPDPAIEFVHPTSVDYMLINRSSRIAEDVLVSFGIVDLDSLPQRPVPIPSVNYDYVNKNSAAGPISWFSNFATPGHRYFGIVYVGCRGGERLRTYWIYVKHGDRNKGFYAERNERDTYQINIMKVATDPNYLEKLVPVSRRRAIQ
ncbi:MAG: hypothetical protein NTZ35_18560 [Ignavibacteriales bacterium]|nr:hypothetical protein [Ignavibacteriales bacterium]